MSMTYVGSISYVKTLRKEDWYLPSDFAPCNHVNKGKERQTGLQIYW